jgi:RNA polymerase sigma-70 factor, ECF subfamily
MPVDEALLLDLARRGSADAVSELYERYWPLAWRWAYLATGNRVRAEDVAQDAICRAFREFARHDPDRPFAPWLKRIVVNRALDATRRERRSSQWFDELRPSLPEEDLPAFEAVVAAVRDLSEPRRLVIVLHYWLDYAVEDIAELLGVPFGTVASRLSRALRDLRAKLEEEHVR